MTLSQLARSFWKLCHVGWLLFTILLLLMLSVLSVFAQSGESDDTTYIFLPFVSHEQMVQAAAGNGILGDRIWNDQNANGVQDIGEPSIAGVTVELLSGCSGSTVAATKLSNVNGDYLFIDLDAAQYQIRVTAPAGLSFTVKDAILDDDYDSDVDGSGLSDCLTLGADEENYRVDVGLTQGLPPTATATPTTPPTNTATAAPPTATATPGGPTNTPTIPPPPTNTPLPSGNAILGDRVWNDLNVNGVQDIGEPGVAGVPIELLAGCTGTTVLATKNTNVNGGFTFSNLGAAQYRLRITVPATFAVTLQDAIADDDYDSDFEAIGVSSCVTLGTTEERYNLDAGITQGPVPTPTQTNTITPVPPTATPTATITPTPAGPTATPTRSGTSILGDRIWNDVNINGVQDIGEAGVAGVPVELLIGCTGTVVAATKTTNVNGAYTFSNLPDDQYRVRITVPTGYSVTLQDAIADDDYDSDMNPSGISSCITLGVGEERYNVDGGITQGVVPTPTNTTVPTPTPTRAPANCPGNLVANGSFEAGFANWNVGTYTSANLTLTNDVYGGGQAALLHGTGSVYMSQFITVIPGGVYNLVGYGKTTNGAIFHAFGINFYDDMNNRVGQGFARVTTTGYQATGAVVNTPVGALFAEAYLYTDGGAEFYGDDLCITVSGGPTPTPTASGNSILGDRVWNDLNVNGVQDIGEPSVANVVVELLSGCSGNALLLTKATNANGDYTFAGLATGQYRVRMQAPGGYSFTVQDAINDDDYDSDVNSTGESACVTLSPGEENYRVDAGVTQGSVPTPTNTPIPATPTPTNTLGPTPTFTPVPPTPTPTRTGTAIIGDRVWRDTNSNGVQDIGERGIPGLPVELLLGCSGSTVLATKSTNANGDYLFTNLPDDQYRLHVIAPAGSIFSPQDAIADDDYDSDVDSLGFSGCITVGVAEENYRIDAGLLP